MAFFTSKLSIIFLTLSFAFSSSPASAYAPDNHHAQSSDDGARNPVLLAAGMVVVAVLFVLTATDRAKNDPEYKRYLESL